MLSTKFRRLALRNYGANYQGVSLVVRFCVSVRPTVNVTEQNAWNRRDSSASCAVKRDRSTHAKRTEATPPASAAQAPRRVVFNNKRFFSANNDESFIHAGSDRMA